MNPCPLCQRMRFALGVTLSHLHELFKQHPETQPFMAGTVFCIEDAIARADGKHTHQ